MKILMTADVHIEHASVKSESILLKTLEKTVEEERPDALLILGDLFDNFGELKSSLAVAVKESLIRIAMGGVKVVIIAGNHDYEKVEDQYFGSSIVSALFSGLESLGIYVCDKEARFIDIDGHKILGIPYRENWEQFERDCLTPIEIYLKRYAVKGGKDEVVGSGIATVGWHCGLPFGEWEVMGGEEHENGWIREGHPAVELLMDIASDKTVYLGHYHKPTAPIPCLDGAFMYVGSPVTRSRSESGEVKRFVLLDTETKERKEIETGLNLDQVVESVEQANEYAEAMTEVFGEDIKSVLRLSVILPAGASLDDYAKAVEGSKSMPYVKVDRPQVAVDSPLRDLEEKHRGEAVPRDVIEVESVILALLEYYKGKDFKHISHEDFKKLGELGYKFWNELSGKEKSAIESALNAAKLKKLASKIEETHIESLADYALAVAESEEIIKSF